MFIGMSTKQKQRQEIEIIPILQGFLSILLFKELEDHNTNNRVLRNSHTKYFIPRVNITAYNVLVVESIFYDQSVNNSIKQYGETRKTATGHRITQQGVC